MHNYWMCDSCGSFHNGNPPQFTFERAGYQKPMQDSLGNNYCDVFCYVAYEEEEKWRDSEAP